MKYIFFLVLALICFGVDGYAQQRVIIDLDIDSDVDDVSALAMLNTMHNRKEIRLIGVAVTSDDSAAADCANVINTYFGNGELPIGILFGQKGMRHFSRYTKQVSEEFVGAKKQLSEYEDAAVLYRRLLASSPDGSVVIVTIGHLSNLQNFLQSRPDRFSKFAGLQLANKKVSKWLCMGGQFPKGKEANFYRPDPGSTVYCLEKWTLPVVFAGWEVGQQIVTGGEYLKAKLDASSPVYRSYQLYNNFAGRASWDQVAVLLLTKDWKRYFDLDAKGICKVEADGSNEWIPGKVSNHSYVKLKPGADVKAIAMSIDDMSVWKK